MNGNPVNEQGSESIRVYTATFSVRACQGRKSQVPFLGSPSAIGYEDLPMRREYSIKVSVTSSCRWIPISSVDDD
jgi:hypothetical protein